jgi:hypothetical protein
VLAALPLVRAGLTLAAAAPIALASDTVSIAIMEAIDNVFVPLVPRGDGGRPRRLAHVGGDRGRVVVAFPFAFLANRYLIARGRGHALVHAYHGH